MANLRTTAIDSHHVRDARNGRSLRDILAGALLAGALALAGGLVGTEAVFGLASWLAEGSQLDAEVVQVDLERGVLTIKGAAGEDDRQLTVAAEAVAQLVDVSPGDWVRLTCGDAARGVGIGRSPCELIVAIEKLQRDPSR